MTTSETIWAISNLIDRAAEMKNAYFWSSPGSSGSRLWYENKYSIPEFSWEEGGHTYTGRYDVRCTCSNIYASGYYTKDGQKTTLTTIKNSLKRLEASI